MIFMTCREEVVRLYSRRNNSAKVSNLVKSGGTNDQWDHGFFASPCRIYTCGKSYFRTHYVSQGAIACGRPPDPKDGSHLWDLRRVYSDRRTLARVLLREGRSLLRPKLVLLDQDGRLCPGCAALHLSNHSVRFLE